MKKKSAIKLICLTATALAIPYIYNKYSEYKYAPLEDIKNDKEFFHTKFGEIAYETYGNMEGKPLLLLHSFDYGSSSLIFSDYLEEFSDYKIYVFDFLGFGLSDKPNITYSFYMYSLIINSFIEEVIGEKATVLALDDATTPLVKASIINPENFEKLVLVNPNLDPLPISKEKSLFTKILRNTYLGEFFYNISLSNFFKNYVVLKSDSLFESDSSDTMLEYSKTGGKYKHNAYVSNLSKNLSLDIASDLDSLKVRTSLVLSDDEVMANNLDLGLNNSLVDIFEIDDSYKAFLFNHIEIIKSAL